MGVLVDNLIDIEPIPLYDLGVNVWLIGRKSPYGSNRSEEIIQELRRHLMVDRGLTNSTTTLYEIYKKIVPSCVGIDLYKMPALLQTHGYLMTIPEHYWCRPFISEGKADGFILLTKDLIFDCNRVTKMKCDPQLIYESEYADKYIEIDEDTLFGIAKDDRALYAIGSYFRANGRKWQPLALTDAKQLYHN